MCLIKHCYQFARGHGINNVRGGAGVNKVQADHVTDAFQELQHYSGIVQKCHQGVEKRRHFGFRGGARGGGGQSASYVHAEGRHNNMASAICSMHPHSQMVPRWARQSRSQKMRWGGAGPMKTKLVLWRQ